MGKAIPIFEDMFQIENCGSVVPGRIGSAWKYAKVGDAIVLCISGGIRIDTAVNIL